MVFFEGQSVHMALVEDFITWTAFMYICLSYSLSALKSLCFLQTELSFQTSHIIILCQTALTATRDFTALKA